MKKLILISFSILIISIITIILNTNQKDNIVIIDENVKNYDFFENKSKFANYLLYQVNDNITCLIDHLNNKFKNTKNSRIREGLLRLSDRYHINKLIENVPTFFNTDTSYTINKGEIIAICLRHKHDTDKFHDINLITFVTVHELSHIFSIGYGHDVEFWENFKFLLEESIKCKIYDNENYTENPRAYCGINVSYNPIFDKNVSNII